MPGPRPRVSLGLPVRDGENYLEAAMCSLLTQSHDDFELIVSDNASTDATPDLVRDLAARDPRVRYVRHETNRGGAWNFGHVLTLARGQLFSWKAHDDLYHRGWLAACVERLDADPALVLCQTRAPAIDALGQPAPVPDDELDLAQARPSARFAELLLRRNRCYPIFGLVRIEALRATRGFGCYPVADRVLLAELSLRGPFGRDERPLFFPRVHPEQSTQTQRTQLERLAWFAPERAGRLAFPEWRALVEYCRAISHSTLPAGEKLACYWVMARWLRGYRRRLTRDLTGAAAYLGRRAFAGFWKNPLES